MTTVTLKPTAVSITTGWNLLGFDKVQADGIERCIPLSFGAINRKFDEKIF